MKTMTLKKQNRFRDKLLLVIVTIPVFILLTEIFFAIVPIDTFFENRFFLVNRALDYPDVFKKDSKLFWRFRPSQTITSHFFEGKTYKINSFGLRGDEITQEPGRIRIAALGNSCTFGWGMEENQTYVRQLENLINSDSILPDVEIINCGIPGYSSFQGRRFFVSDIVSLQPDIVMMMFGWNDQWAAAGNISDADQKLPPQWVIDIQNTVSRLKIYRFMRKIILSITDVPLEERIGKKETVYRTSFYEFYQNLLAIWDFARNEGMQSMILTAPIPSLKKYYPPGAASPMHDYHLRYNLQARLLARNTKSPLIDADHEFLPYDNLYDNAGRDPIHFNAEGHRVIAEAAYKYFKEHPEFLAPKGEPIDNSIPKLRRPLN